MAENAGIDPVSAWFVSVTSQTGTLPEGTNYHVFDTRGSAEEFVASIPEGTVLTGDGEAYFGKEVWAGIKNKDDFLLRASRAGDQDTGLPFQTLSEANVFDGSNLSEHVRDSLGHERLDEMRLAFGDNWSGVAAFEYSMYSFAPSSPAYIAAQQQYAFFVQNDDFSAGYLLRDLEIVTHGVEQAVTRALEYSDRQAKIAAKGGEAQVAKAAERKKELFRIALQNLSQWIWRSEKDQIRVIKRLVSRNDPDSIFLHGGKEMSDEWFANALSELRSSGELERSMEKPQGFFPDRRAS